VDDDEVPAGPFSSWLRATLDGLASGQGIDVPCGSCTACCRSAYFIHVAPDEVETLRRIPAALRFPAPGLPKGHVVMGYDERGHCPMLVDDRCSIYEHRPRTCRTYDCRVFAAAGVTVDDERQRAIADRVARWRFEHPDEADRTEHAAVRAAAAFLRSDRDGLGDAAPVNATQLAVLAVRISDLFDSARPEPEAVRVAVRARLAAPAGAS
jgi:Fe-S-cluster containining protein